MAKRKRRGGTVTRIPVLREVPFGQGVRMDNDAPGTLELVLRSDVEQAVLPKDFVMFTLEALDQRVVVTVGDFLAHYYRNAER